MTNRSIAKEWVLDIAGVVVLLIVLLNLGNTDTWVALASTAIFAVVSFTRTAMRSRRLARQRRQP